MRWLALLAVLSGCHLVFDFHRDDDVPEDATLDAPPDAQVFDRDGDGIDDAVDTCLATIEDDTADDDGDLITNVADPCPFNTTPTTNADGDDLPDACDPFTSSAGDHHLCAMTIANTNLASALWMPRTGSEIAWVTTDPGHLIVTLVGQQIATVIAAASLEGANLTTYQGVFTFTTHGKPGGITLWLRADPTAPTADDLGCHIESTTGLTPVKVGVIAKIGFRDQKTVAFSPGRQNDLRIQGSLATMGPNVLVTCRFTITGSPVETSTATVTLVPGRFGVTTDRWDATLDGLYITDRP